MITVRFDTGPPNSALIVFVRLVFAEQPWYEYVNKNNTRTVLS